MLTPHQLLIYEDHAEVDEKQFIAIYGRITLDSTPLVTIYEDHAEVDEKQFTLLPYMDV